MARVFTRAELPRFESTRDTRDRLDLATENVPVAARALRADRIVYHPGDTAAAHFHKGCSHVFYVLRGTGVAHLGGEWHRLRPGSVAAVEPGEAHWFENDGDEDFAFVEFWSPPPTKTVWVNEGDACTWTRAAVPVEA